MGWTDEDDRIFKRLFKRIRKDPNIVRVGKVFVDVEGTVERRVSCSDGLCMHTRKLKKLAGKTCCTTFRVPVEELDVERIARVVGEVRKIRDVDAAIDEADGWWEIQDDGAYLNTRDNGACVFLSAPPGEMPLCTIHEWAVNQGYEFRDHKPETCCLFPLYLPEWEDDVLVTSYGTPYMKEAEGGESDETYPFVCLHPDEGEGRSVLVEQEEELDYRLGKERWQGVLAKLRALGHPV